MEWLDGLNKSIDYIEQNLTGKVDINTAARLALCSVFHYQRTFAYITGVTITEYIRRRRMTLAAFELINCDAKVIDLALKYGYDSPTAFNRAFQGVHGVSPSKAKKSGIKLTSFPQLTFTISIKGAEAMNFKIVKKDSFRIVGYKTKEHMTMEDCFEKIPVFWDKVVKQGGLEKLIKIADCTKQEGILGVSTCDNGDFSGYFISVATNASVPEGMEEYTVPSGTYAIFECIGAMPNSMQELQKRIISEWLPTSGYEYAQAPDIEVYFEGNQQSDDYRSEVWLPIVKK